MSYSPLLEAKDLNTRIYSKDLIVNAVCDFELSLKKEEILCIIGESGCGKTMSVLSLTNLIPNNAKIIKGEIKLEEKSINLHNENFMEKIRGSKISYVFQDATSSLNPIFTIGSQIKEMIIMHQHLKENEAIKATHRALELVDLKPAEKFFSFYPHQLSGGMNQRAMIAMAISSNPKILIADEPTSNLDRITELKIIDLLKDLNRRLKISIIFITHNISIIKDFANTLIVMYYGRIVEKGTKDEVLSNSKHPYTQGLLKCIPKIGKNEKRLATIKGQVPELSNLPSGCKFHPRCPYAMDKCKEEEPEFCKITQTHYSKCYLQQKS